MKKLPDLSCDFSVKSKKGFALVLALSLMSLVFLLVVSLVSLVSTDLNLSELRKQKVLAQANARMGMMVALGEIQKHLGPDTRISATADILDERVELNNQFKDKKYDPNQQVIDGIDLNEDNNFNKMPFGQRYWTGVWKNRAKSKGGLSPGTRPSPNILETGNSVNKGIMHDSEFDPHPAVEVAWLVSGNEGYEGKLAAMQGTGSLISRLDYIEIPDAIEKDQRYFNGSQSIYGNEDNAWLDFQDAVKELFSNKDQDFYNPRYYHPLLELPDPDDVQFPNQTVWMLKKPLLKSSYDPERPLDWRNHLSGEPIKVRKTKFEMPDEENGNLSIQNAYAYWVGDEGVKTKVNLSNPKGKDVWDNLSVANEPNLEAGFEIKINTISDELIKSKIQSLGLFPNPDILEILINNSSDSITKIDWFAPHYHSLTTDSYGVLADVRTGGLKRDLSSAFEVKDSVWDKDFNTYLYQDRIYYMKNLSYRPNAYANQWNDEGSGPEAPTVDDKNTILAGPKWSVLKDFHNKWEEVGSSGSVSLEESDLLPDKFPRIVGDNNVVFAERPNNPNRELRKFSIDDLVDYFNHFDNPSIRPEPTNHSLLPKLLEFKFSSVPTWVPTGEEGTIALSMYPSVSFWNPYNFPININDVYIEIPMNVGLVAFNPKEWDLVRQWWLHDPTAVVWQPQPPLIPEHYQIPFHATTSTTSQPSQRWPGGGSTYFDVNGNGRWDPGEPRNWVPRPPRPPGGGGGGGGNNNPKPFRIRRDLAFEGNFNIGSIRHPKSGQTFFQFRNGNYGGFPKHKSFNAAGRIPEYRIFNSVRLDQNNRKPSDLIVQRHLLLKIRNLNLEAGEKSHFVVSNKTECEWIDPWNKLNNEIRKPKYIQYFGVNLMEGSEEIAEPLICKTGFYQKSDEPLSLRFHLGTITGVNRVIKEDFEADDADRKKSSDYFKPQGIQVFTLNTEINIDAINKADTNQIDLLNDEDNRELILSINKEFGLHVGSGRLDFQRSDVLEDVHERVDMPPSKLYGNGYRIRWKLPGNADSVVFNQYNVRALVESLQDGYGDNWELETFNATHYQSKVGRHYSHAGCNPRWHLHSCAANSGYDFEYFNFYANPAREGEPLDESEDFNSTCLNLPPVGFESMSTLPFNFGPDAIVPKAGMPVTSDKHFTGFFHDKINLANGMEATNSAVMFDLPRSPLLSIAQFKHANLNNYSHGPSYVVGNSYASPQVSRYKTWARVRALMMQPMGSMDIIGQMSKFRFDIPHPFGPPLKPLRINLFPWASNWNTEFAAIRDTEAQNEHQNVTLDHSFYANRALFDGYFLSGTDGADFTRYPADLKPGEKYRPFRNSRIIPYIRSGDNSDQTEEVWSLTNYDQKIDNSQKSTSASNEDLQYQTLAGDLLLDGAFNINSTSVEAWISQLSALKGIDLPGESTSGKTPFPRFFDGIDENKWNKTSMLDDTEIRELAINLVKQIKLRGPFLSYADFVNRRIQTDSYVIDGKENQSLLFYPFTQWPDETRNSSIGLRGPIQAAIADSEINQGGFKFKLSKESMGNPSIPAIPSERFSGGIYLEEPIIDRFNFAKLNYLTSDFGIHAINSKLFRNLNNSSDLNQIVYSEPATPNPSTSSPIKPNHYVKSVQGWGLGVEERKEQIPTPPAAAYEIPTAPGSTAYTEDRVQQNMIYYQNTFMNGEAPDNFLAVENVATAALKPGWLMQADVLTPLAPVSSARSDTFTIRVMGENLPTDGQGFSSRAWIELTVQRTPDYVKADLDAPHHRPHEPFEDANFDGIWNGREEHWLDLNQNSYDRDGSDVTNGIEAGPDLPGVGTTGANRLYADGLKSDLKLKEDKWEETLSIADKDISYQGINQRFGRKFKIIKFRWLNEKDV